MSTPTVETRVTLPAMPAATSEKRLASAARRIDTATAERDAAIRELHEAGRSLREIAELAGRGPDGTLRLSHAGVAKILQRGTA